MPQQGGQGSGSPGLSHGSIPGFALGNVVSRLLAYSAPYANCNVCQHFTNVITPRLNRKDL
jgi:hypothetical protein